MDFVTLPIVTWLVCGTVKWTFNYIRGRSNAFKLIGHGGFPSNHTAIVSSLLWVFLLAREWRMAGVVIALLMVVVFDATGLRREIGRHAAAINQLTGSKHREITGHTPLDIMVGLLVGLAVAVAYRILRQSQ